MRKCIGCFSLLFSIVFTASAQIDSVRQHIYLVGDAGELYNGKHPVVDWLKKNVDWNNERNSVIYLGDNIYPHGLPTEGEETYEEAKAIIDYQISLVKGKKGKAYFIPGNHDWWNGKIGGWQRVINQTNYINSQGLANIVALPTEGCPGPQEEEIDEKVVIVGMDSQWFMHVHDKPGPSSNCRSKTQDEFETELKEIVATHPNQLLILALHHPPFSYGIHGGDFGWRQHIFPLADAIPGLYLPLPVLGSVYPIVRGVFGNLQDVNHPLYRSMANMVEEVVKDHPNPIVVSGHEHSLQLIMKDSIPYIVSGSGSNSTRVKGGRYSLFHDPQYGFAVIEVRKSGRVETKFYDLTSTDLSTPKFSKVLKPIVPPIASAGLDSLLPLPDSITIAANGKLAGNGFRNMIMGRNYRKEWTQAVTVPVLDLGQEQGGLRPERKGGGKQTKSLRLVDKTGKEWALRSIEKFPEAAIPPDLRQSFAKEVVEQGISASYPYVSLSIEPIAKAAGLPTIRRKLVYVPDDPRLNRFRNDFDSTLAVLEEREPINVKKTDNTDELVLKLAKDNDNHIDQRAVLRARLVDNFIMDFDRHEDQWRWATYDTGKGKVYYPIPRDHDQAFFISQGLLPKFIRKPWIVPEIQGFRASADNVKTFNRPARNFDRFFLTELSKEDWSKAIDTFLSRMTDDVLEQSLRRQPVEIQQYRMSEIISKLKAKRKYFMQNMMDYYNFISKEVSVVGTNQREQFTVSKNENGNVIVTVNKITKEDVVGPQMYKRLFLPDETKEVKLYGLNDDDRFIVEGGASPIKVRIIGGPGEDKFINKGTGGKVLVYDVTFEKNEITGNPGLYNKLSKSPQANIYNRLNYKYEFINPGISIVYNVDDGLYLGARAEYIKQGFRKEPYSMRQFIMANRALRTSSFRIRYESDYIGVIGRQDLIVRADVRAPINVTNFFGIGNDTKIDKGLTNWQQYYRSRYNIADVSVLLRQQKQSWMRLNYGPTFQYFHTEEEQNKGRFINNTTLSGLNLSTLYNSRLYVGALFKLDIDSKNNDVLPTRGLVLDANVRPLFGLNKYSHNLVQLNANMSVFISVANRQRYVLANRIGYGKNIGKYEFQQAQYLSGTDNLRGYRRNRFAGRTVLYNNTELRFKIADFSTYLFPGSIGLHAFHDVGRVWSDKDLTNKWHRGFGGGVWLAPIRRFVLTGSLTYSKEEKSLPLFTFGYQF